MNDFKITSNRGNATYYIMMVIMVITIMTSGLLYVSLRSSVVSHNYATDIQDYNKCDSALMKVKGELKAALVGKTTSENENSLSNHICLAQTLEPGYGYIYYFPKNINADPNKPSLPLILGNDVDLVKTGELEGFEIKFCAEQDNVNNKIEKYFIIYGVTVESGKVGIKTDIKIMLGSDNIISDVVFDGYQTYDVTPVTEEPAEGGEPQ